MRRVGRDHEINRLGSAKCLGKRRRIGGVGNESFGALLNKTFQAPRVAPNHSNLLSMGQQLPGNDPSCIPARTDNCIHGCTSVLI